MDIVRIYADEGGESHIQDLPVEMVESGLAGRMSELWAATGVIFREVGADYDLDWHNAPRRQLVVNLTGSVEIEASDGTVRRMEAGSILLAEDTTGKGHLSRNPSGEPRRCLFVPLD
ncbi:MAG: hypothetical protein GY929_13910 [Actinomycetia bacterium]|nr:hypothetical protein [Actinomycetes bacterium]